VRSLSNEVMRRLDSFSPGRPISEKVAVLDTFSQKLINSGHVISVVRNILVSGIRGYTRRVSRCLEQGIPLHRSAGQSSGARRKKKLLANSNWFREPSKDEGEQDNPAGGKQTGHYSSRAPLPRTQRAAPQTAKLRTTSILFVEFSNGGLLQKKMRECLDKITPLLGFRVRVTEKGGTALGSLLSNKDLWRGEPCGRTSCKPCAQPGDKKEPCIRCNIVYESECVPCNPAGSRKESDKTSLADVREQPSLYVGESARSLNERAGEHWRDAESGKEESHMLQHQSGVHGADRPPEFSFRVVSQCKSSLERQVREAVRIQMRGNVLNIKGTYNRCKLTRLVVDEEWEQKVWNESWEPRVVTTEEDSIRAGSGKERRREEDHTMRKRSKVSQGNWGNASPSKQKSRDTFLYTGNSQERAGTNLKQATIQPITGVEWLSRKVVENLVNRVVDIGEWSKDASSWEEWEPEEQIGKRSRKEEMWLWKQLY
jgi:hypothetical protein